MWWIWIVLAVLVIPPIIVERSAKGIPFWDLKRQQYTILAFFCLLMALVISPIFLDPERLEQALLLMVTFFLLLTVLASTFATLAFTGGGRVTGPGTIYSFGKEEYLSETEEKELNILQHFVSGLKIKNISAHQDHLSLDFRVKFVATRPMKDLDLEAKIELIKLELREKARILLAQEKDEIVRQIHALCQELSKEGLSLQLQSIEKREQFLGKNS